MKIVLVHTLYAFAIQVNLIFQSYYLCFVIYLI